MTSKDLETTARAVFFKKHSKGLDMGIPSIHQYEAWLDVLDERMYAKDGWLISELGDTFKIPTHEVDSPEKLIATAKVFRASIGREFCRDELYLVTEGYLVKRFYRLLDREHQYEKKFGLSIEQFAAEMKVGWQSQHTSE